MKLVITTGRVELRPRKLCGMTANFASGDHKGEPLYKVPEYQRRVEWKNRDGGRLVMTEYDLPNYTNIELYAFGREGNDRRYFRRIFTLNPDAEITEIEILVSSIETFYAKGRLVQVVDLRAADPIDYEGGF